MKTLLVIQEILSCLIVLLLMHDVWISKHSLKSKKELFAKLSVFAFYFVLTPLTHIDIDNFTFLDASIIIALIGLTISSVKMWLS